MTTAWIGLAALGLRLFHLWQTHEQLVSRTLMGDAVAYDAWARRIAAGDWLGHGVFYQSPLYAYWLAGIYGWSGGSVVAARIVQAMVGALSCVVLARAAEHFFSRRVGWVVGIMMAVYPTAVFFDGVIQKSSLDLLLVSLLLLLVARATPETGILGWLVTGVTLGALMLNRENALLLVVPLGLWLVGLHGIRSRRWVTAAALCALGCTLVLGPVAARNLRVGGELFPTTSQFGTNFFIGNHPGASGRYEPLRWGNGSAESEQADAVELAEKALGRTLSSGQVSRYWFERGWSYIRTQPGDWLRLTERKALLLVNSAEISDTEDLYTWADGSWVLAATTPILHLGLLAPLAAVGIILTWPSLRRLWILHALLLTYAGSVVLFFVNARYRYPLVPMLMLFAGAAIAHPWRQSLSQRRYAQTAAALAVAVAIGLASNRRLVDVDAMRAVTALNLGAYMAERGEKGVAVKCFSRAIELKPDFADAHYNLGLALVEMGRLEEAAAPFARAADLAPDQPKARRALRWIQDRRGDAAGRAGAGDAPATQ